jgi:1-acyl-sn-glycerol-3-phosphate acyltransferase
VTRWALRALCVVARTRVLGVEGFEHILPDRDPFILALNHTQRVEALLIPALLTLLRGGKMIHFLSDWNFRLIPGVSQLFSAGETIVLTRKSARPRVLNLLKPLYAEPTSGFARARRRLERGAPVGIFPEGTVNPDPVRLLRGRSGMAWLSLTTGVPVAPAGIRFPGASVIRPIPDFAPLALSIGEPMDPPILGRVPRLAEVRAWHEAVMRRIAALCDKAWHPTHRRDAS